MKKPDEAGAVTACRGADQLGGEQALGFGACLQRPVRPLIRRTALAKSHYSCPSVTPSPSQSTGSSMQSRWKARLLMMLLAMEAWIITIFDSKQIWLCHKNAYRFCMDTKTAMIISVVIFCYIINICEMIYRPSLNRFEAYKPDRPLQAGSPAASSQSPQQTRTERRPGCRRRCSALANARRSASAGDGRDYKAPPTEEMGKPGPNAQSLGQSSRGRWLARRPFCSWPDAPNAFVIEGYHDTTH
jgi:hypothetical protein